MKLTFFVNYEPYWAELLRMKGWSLALLGNQDVLGSWNDENAIILSTTNFRSWSVEVDAAGFVFPVEYKYVIFDSKKDSLIAWESRENRLSTDILFENETAMFVDTDLQFDVQLFHGAGVAIPIFSLRSKESFGVGEFLDLKKMIDWAAMTSQQMIQTLPINDTTLQHTEADSYPYNTLSVFALHPMYLRLQSLGQLKDRKKQTYFNEQRECLNALPSVDYKQINDLKWRYFRLIYQQEKDNVFALEEYKKYVKKNVEWLLPYAAFSYLRDINGTCDFSQWGIFSKFDSEAVRKLSSEKADELGFYYYLQYHLHLQLSEVHTYAKKYGVLLKGDIPIGVSPKSVDVWCHPQLFNTDTQAGAPPDDFSEKGQNWGFPTYRWRTMAKDDFSWWKARLQHMSKYFDAYRIDHILGFFRIWEIPLHAKWGLLGQFNPAMPFTKDNIISYGLKLEDEKSLNPYITDDILNRYFGKMADDVKSIFLRFNDSGVYEMNPNFDAQRKIEVYFSEKEELTPQDEVIRDGLFRLLCQVLFLQDKKYSDLYHPRISYQENEAFIALNKKEKQAYIRLYEEYFYYRHNEFWKQQALQKLPTLLKATSMLSCGEDLGMIPSCVPEVMSELHLLSLEIQRMPKKMGQDFGVLYFTPYLSVCTTSTHDMSPMRLWWQEDREKTQRFYNTVLFEQGEAPFICEPWIAEKIIHQHLQSPAMWVVLPLQDWLAMDANLCNIDPATERINVPDNPENVWCYRMHIDLDNLLQATDFNQKIKELIQIERA